MINPSTKAQQHHGLWSQMRIKTRVVVVLFIIYSSLIISSIVPTLFTSSPQVTPAKVLSDLRTYETALSTYKIDHGIYPSWQINPPPLTTPVSYLVTMIKDPFAKPTTTNPEAWIRYASDDRHFIIWSVGRDKVSQIAGIPDVHVGLESLQQKSYDASNGTISAGDIWRTNVGRDKNLESYKLAPIRNGDNNEASNTR